MQRIGILGGSFDPVHNGHLLLAQEILSELDLNRIIMMPTRIQPFKQDQKTASVEDRLAMLELATSDNDIFEISTIELDRDEVSYTINSLRILSEQYKDETELLFIIGYDMFLNITKWWEAEQLLKDYSIVVGMRPGVDDEEINSFADKLRKEYGATIYCVNNREFDVSSTEIKERIKEGRSLKYLVPDSVIEYIYEKELYRD